MRATTPKANEAGRLGQPQTATILLVEDEAAVREVTREALELGGYSVLEASGPEDAVRIARELPDQIDLLLTDVVMPSMSGPDLAREIGKVRPGVVTVYMSGYAESEVLRSAARGALLDHIQKPFTVSGLLARVCQALATQWHGEIGDRATQLPSP
jgi:two-component system, cell cycle sensor histidine kinase and response regulator CckA